MKNTWLPLARLSVSISRNKAVFRKFDFPKHKKSPNKRTLFQVDRKSVSTSRNGEVV